MSRCGMRLAHDHAEQADPPLGFAVAGPIAAVVGDRAAFLAAAAIVIASTALVLVSRDRAEPAAR